MAERSRIGAFGMHQNYQNHLVKARKINRMIHSAAAGGRVSSTLMRRQSRPANSALNWAWFSAITPPLIAPSHRLQANDCRAAGPGESRILQPLVGHPLPCRRCLHRREGPDRCHPSRAASACPPDASGRQRKCPLSSDLLCKSPAAQRVNGSLCSTDDTSAANPS